MKLCLTCNTPYSVSQRQCFNCRTGPAVVKGFDAYAPQLAHYGSGFKASYFSELAELEKANFWFQKRNELIIWALNKYTPHFESFLEIGCGTGFVLTGISNNFPSAQLNGSEIFIEGLGFAAKRLPSVNLMRMDARQIPFINEFGVIGAFDVLEHIKEDELVLKEIHKALRPDGMIFLTVPQHPWLWSTVDEYALHERRYTEKEILDKLIAAGFRIIRSTSFVTTLLPAMAISRTFQKHKSKKFESTTELKINPILNSFFAQLLNVEISGIKIGMSYPAGGSRLVIAKKS